MTHCGVSSETQPYARGVTVSETGMCRGVVWAYHDVMCGRGQAAGMDRDAGVLWVS